MNAKTIGIGLGIGACAVAAVFLWGGAGRGGRIAGPAPVAKPVLASPGELDRPDETDADTPRQRPVQRVEVEPAQAPPERLWKEELAGVFGRVVESDGTPVPDIPVTLLEADGAILFSALDDAQPTLDLAETRTDAEGRFAFEGAWGSSFHALGIDVEGPRATLRMIDRSLRHGERTDLGDIVLDPRAVLIGQVVDEAGNPVQGARVRAAALPEELAALRLHLVGKHTAIGISMLDVGGDGRGIVELPDWVADALERFPVPTDRTDADGAFRLEVPAGQVVGGVDLRGWAGLGLGPLEASGETDLGRLVLPHGRTLRGAVEDSFGDPVPGAEVWAGAEVQPGIFSILHRHTADETGRFEIRGIPSPGQIVVAARRTPYEPWVTALPAEGEDVLLEVEAPVAVSVRVQTPNEEPVRGAMVRLLPRRSSEGAMWGATEVLALLPRPASPREAFREVEPGLYRGPLVTPEDYELVVKASGHAESRRIVELWEEENEVTVVLQPGSTIDVTVVDGITNEPIDGARLWVFSMGPAGFLRLGGGTTDDQGKARLGPLSPPVVGESERAGLFGSESRMLLVRHPDYGEVSRMLGSEATVRIEVRPGGSIAGRVHWGGETPTRTYMVVAEYRGGNDDLRELFDPPRFTVTDLTGQFQLDGLKEGKWRLSLNERFLDQDLLGLMNDAFEPADLHRETVEVLVGQTTSVEIDLTPSGRGPVGRLRGRVRVNGRDVQGATVSLRGNGTLEVETNAYGRFETPEFPVSSKVRVTIEGDVPLSGGRRRRLRIYRNNLRIPSGEVRELDLDLYPIELSVQVVEAGSGAPVSGAEVTATLLEKVQGATSGFADLEARTDESGEASILVDRPGMVSFLVEREGYARASREVVVEERNVQPIEVELRRPVPCSGRVLIPDGLVQDGVPYLFVRGDGHAAQDGTVLRPPDYDFTLEGLSPGPYKAQIYTNFRPGEEIPFELGPAGVRDLVLEYVPKQ